MKDLKLEDYQLIKPFLDMANYEGCNSNFVTMMMWNHEYHIQYEIHDNFLIMLQTYKGIRYWAMPFTREQYYQEAIDYMINYSKEHGFDFLMDCAIEPFVEKIKPLYNDVLLFERTPYNDDYIYDKQMHLTLSGKKMQKRRNHYNAFIKNYPDFQYRDLDMKDDFNIILKCLNQWEHNKEGLSESMTSETYGIMYLLSSIGIIDFKIGGIFIDNQLEGFIIGSPLNHQTIQIHVEKANSEIRGLYPALLKAFLEHHYKDYLYINREEDMGLENLRKSKRALYPINMVYKYRIYLKDTKITQANDNDLDQIKQLWLERFEDEDEKSTDFYFQNYYKKENTYVYKQKDQVICALQIVPIEIEGQQNARFILGVTTHPLFEKQGCMKTLLSYVLDLYKESPIYLQAYVPQIYEHFGFKASHYHKLYDIPYESLSINNTNEIINDYSLLSKYYNTFTKVFTQYRIRNQDYWDLYIKKCECFNEKIVIIKDKGYIVYHEKDNSISISEFVYLKKEYIPDLLNYFYDLHKNIRLECDITVQLDDEYKEIITMMSNNRDDNEIYSRFINEIY